MQAFPWLLHEKIAVPDRVDGYLHRAGLVRRAMPTRRRLTVLKAAGGFGKTTLLAECCRRLRRRGVATAWVSLDEQDEPAVLDTYIAFAGQSAGLELKGMSGPQGTGAGPESRIGVVLREIQAWDNPFVFAFDEAERLENPASVALLEFLRQRGPANLHLAISCRRIPVGLNVAGAAMDGRAVVVTADELRFSRTEVGRCFDPPLSRRELSAEMGRSAGWPFALRIARNRMERGTRTDAGIVKDFVRNWHETRLLADLDADDREFLLDIGLFDWMDAPLLDEVLQRGDSLQRLRSMRVLAGLLEPVGGVESENWRLHPLVREYCVERCMRESPQRFLAVHRRIAAALARRGYPVPAMRHAVRGGDPALAGEILMRAGGVRLWIMQGLSQLQTADGYLTENAISNHPRLALVRCVTMLMTGRVYEARKLYGELDATGPERDANEPLADIQHFVDDCIVRGAIALYGGEPMGSDWTQRLFTDYERLAKSRRLDPLARGYAAYGLGILYQLQGAFDRAIDWLERARHFLAHSQYIAVYGELLRGQVNMAQGQVQEAESRYRRAQRMARKHFVPDPVPAAVAEVMLRELAMERDPNATADRLHRIPIALMKHGAPHSPFATACALVIEQSLRAGRVRQALTRAGELLDYTRGADLTSLARYVSALHISVLVIAGRMHDAERAWRLAKLPEDAAGCVDLDGQGWREMEAVACARLRWLTAAGRFGDGRDLARAFRRVAAGRRLKRTLMRATVLSVVLEQRAGQPESAMAHLEHFLELFSTTAYAWPLVQERAVCAPLTAAFLKRNPESPFRDSAQWLHAAMRRAGDDGGVVLGERELAVLNLLEGRRDKQIGAELGLSAHGVRYHLRNVFAKLRVTSRSDAVRRAMEIGLIGDES